MAETTKPFDIHQFEIEVNKMALIEAIKKYGISPSRKVYVKSATVSLFSGAIPETKTPTIPIDEQLEAVLDRYNKRIKLLTVEKELQPLTDRINGIESIVMGLITNIQDTPIIYNAEISDLSSEKYRLNRSLIISIEKYEDEYIASFPEIETFGASETETLAILELKKSIISLYEELKSFKDHELGILPKSWFRLLRELIEE